MDQQPTHVPSLFKQLTNQEKSSLNLTKNIRDKRAFIKTIIKTKLHSKHLKTKPLAIKKLKVGIHNILFGNNKQKGTFDEAVTKLELGHKNPFSNPIRQKINCSSLVYLSFKELEPNVNSRKYFKQKETLLTSNNFYISNNVSLFNPKKDHNNTTLASKSPNQSILNRHSFMAELKTKATISDTLTQSQIKSYSLMNGNKKATKQKPINLKLHFTSNNYSKATITTQFPSIKTKTNVLSKTTAQINNDSLIRNCYLDSETKKRNKLKKEKRRRINQLIYDKVNELSTSRSSNEKKLFEIIDNSQRREEPISKVIREDLEQIFDIKLKKQSKVGETKKAIIQAMKVNATKHMMLDETKARMIELSDRINKLTDEEALVYAERIAEEYYRNNKQLEEQNYSSYDVNELHEKRKTQMEQRHRIYLNEKKICVLKNKILKESRKFFQHLDNKNKEYML